MFAQAASFFSSVPLASLLANLMFGAVTSIRIKLLMIYYWEKQLSRHYEYGQLS